MQKTIKSIRAILLAIVLAVGVFAATPAPVYATIPTLNISGTNVNSISEFSVSVQVTVDNIVSDVYVAVYLASDPPLTTGAQVKSPIGSIDAGSSLNLSAGVPANILIGGVAPATDYIAYVVAEDPSNLGDFSTVLALPFTTWPIITSATNYSCVAGTGGSFSLTAIGTPPIAWSASGAPAGVTITGNTLIVAASVPAGTYSFTITVNSIVGGNDEGIASQTFTLTVTAAGGGGTTGGGGAAATTGVSPKTDDATGGNMFLLVMMLLLAAGAVYTGRKVAKANK